MSLLQPTITSRFSMGFKLIFVCGLALFMSIFALFVNGLVDDRTGRASEVTRQISSVVGGPQTFLGPTLLVPYTVQSPDRKQAPVHGVYAIFPSDASAAIDTRTEERHRSLFKVPVFKADAALRADFDVPEVQWPGAILDWAGSEIVVGISDPRGALADATLTSAAGTTVMGPSVTAPMVTLGKEDSKRSLTLFGTPTSGAVKPGAHFHVSAALHFSGAQRITLLPYGKTTHATLRGDWPNPGFDGAFLPSARNDVKSGFEAQWSVPFIARGVPAVGGLEIISGLDNASIAATFVEVADPYQSVTRSLKFAPLFLGLIFLSYFLFEVTTGRRVHPAQYVLVGIAQLIFYLLMLSLGERIGFDAGYLIGGTATVLLLSVNAGWVFAARRQGVRAVAIFGALYGMIYLLLRLEDNALLLGAFGSFLLVAAAMYFTRSINWYGVGIMPANATADDAPHAYRVGEL